MSSTTNLWLLNLAAYDLPALQILAPGAFKPWPMWRSSCRGSRNASPQKAIVHDTKAGSVQRYLGSRRIQSPNKWCFQTKRPRKTELREWRHSRSLHISKNTNSGQIRVDEDRFRKVYEDVWGSEQAIKRFPSVDSLVGEEIEAKFATGRLERAEGHNHKAGKERESSTRTFRKSVLVEQPQSRSNRLKILPSFSNNRKKFIRPRPLRARTVRLVFGQKRAPDLFSSLWSKEFAQLNLRHDGQVGSGKLRRHRFSVRSVVAGTGFSARALSSASVQEIEEAWEALSPVERKTLWSQKMLGALYSNPRWALKFLIATGSKLEAPGYAISDSLEYLVSHYVCGVELPDPGTVANLYRILVGFLAKFDPHYVHLTQKTIFLLLSHINVDQAEQLYWTLVQRKHPIHENTYLQLAHKFARNRRTQSAVDALRKFREDGGNFAQPKVESVCATLLQLKNRNSSDSAIPDSEIFGLLLDLGLRPNIIIYNILIKNAVDSDDSGTAWQIHNMLPKLGIKADANTYSILLNDAKLRQDRLAMKQIVDIVELRDMANEYIITDILHSMFLTCEQDRRETHSQLPSPAPLKGMLPLYAEYFNLEPIRDLLPQIHRNVIPHSNRTKMHPPRETLVVILIALLRGFVNPHDVPRWYRRFRTMLLNGHPDIVDLTKSTHIYDAVIMCLGRWPTTLHLCTKVVGDMLSSCAAAQKTPTRSYSVEPRDTSVVTTLPRNPMFESFQEWDSGIGNNAPNLAAKEHSIIGYEQHSETIHESTFDGSRHEHAIVHGHCKPSVRTWSILLKAFVDHNQPRAAEKVFNMMRRAGIKPNQVTWNSLAIGYARLQDIPNTVDVIERLEDEGWNADDITIKGLQSIRDRKALTESLQEKARRQKRRQSEKCEPLKAIYPPLDLSAPGGLDDVIKDGQLPTVREEHPLETLPIPKNLRAPSNDKSRHLRLHKNELKFIRKAYPIGRNVDSLPDDLPSMQDHVDIANVSDKGSDQGNDQERSLGGTCIA